MVEARKIVLFAGTTGFGKSEYLRRFREYALGRNGFSVGSSDADEFVRLVKFEDWLVKLDGSVGIDTFLRKHSQREKLKAVEVAFAEISRLLAESSSAYTFLDVHMSYYKNSSFFPPFLSPSYNGLIRASGAAEVIVIALMDDLFVVWKVLRSKASEYPETALRLREINAWRSFEVLQADTASMNLTPDRRESYLFAIRHPPYALYDLIFQKNPKIGYLSYPIRKVRKDIGFVSEINGYRREAHAIAEREGSLFFDPITLDELLLVLAERENGTVEITEEMRWPLGENPLLPHPHPFPIEMPYPEVEEVRPDIINNTRTRDFRLVDSSHFLAAYRPYLGGQSEGVRAEMDYAVQTGKAEMVYDPDSTSDSSSGPFGSEITPLTDKKEFMKRLAGGLKRPENILLGV